MVAFNVTVEDTSPLINYNPSGSWADAPLDDPSISSYSGGSLHTTQSQNAQATISFNGTGIWIYGFERPNFGTFTISIDGRKVDSAANTGVNSSKKLLASIHGLVNGPHTVVVTNGEDKKPLNIDYLDIQHDIGFNDSSVVTTVIDDTDPKLTYQPASNWFLNTGTGFMNNTLHFTRTNGSSVSTSFRGDAIAVYGTVSNDHAHIQVSLDGRTTSFSAGSDPGQAASLHTKVLLYFADTVGPGEHRITMSSDIQNVQAPFIDVDSFVVYSFNGGSSTSATSPTGSSKSISTATIIGAAVGGGVGLLLCIALIIFFILRRRKTRDDKVSSPSTPTFIQQADMSDVSRPRAFPPPIPRSRSVHSIAPSYYGASLDTPTFNHTRAASGASSATSTTAMLRDVPKLGVPKTPTSSRPISPASDAPSRPRPPPPLDLATTSFY